MAIKFENIWGRKSAPPMQFNVNDFHCKDRKKSQKWNFSKHQHFIIYDYCYGVVLVEWRFIRTQIESIFAISNTKKILIYDVDFVRGFNNCQYDFGIQLCSILAMCWKL